MGETDTLNPKINLALRAVDIRNSDSNMNINLDIRNLPLALLEQSKLGCNSDKFSHKTTILFEKYLSFFPLVEKNLNLHFCLMISSNDIYHYIAIPVWLCFRKALLLYNYN